MVNEILNQIVNIYNPNSKNQNIATLDKRIKSIQYLFSTSRGTVTKLLKNECCYKVTICGNSIPVKSKLISDNRRDLD